MFVSSNNLSAWFQVAGAWIPSHPSPESADRVITCGFSQLQRIGGGAQINMWLPKTRNTPSITPNVPLQWTAIRQVEILFEGSHLELFDMDMDEFKRSLRFFNACRAGGQRLAVVIGGIYKGAKAPQDHLAQFDAALRDRLQNIVNILWLDEFSAASARRTPGDTSWDIASLLPFVGTALGATQMFQRKTAVTASLINSHEQAAKFIVNIERMPKSSAREHNIFVGLKIPNHQPDNDIDWGPAPEFQRLPFMQALQSVFNTFGMDTPTAHHPRAHGDHMNCRKRAYPNHFLGVASC